MSRRVSKREVAGDAQDAGRRPQLEGAPADQSAAVERRAAFLADHDELTGLVNRAAFQAAVARALAAAGRDGRRAAVIVVDVDRFGMINNSLGHAAGDRLLRVMAQRLGAAVRGADLVARLGGDEMGLLLHDVRDAAHAVRIAELVLGALRQPVELDDGTPVLTTASAGIALFPQDGGDVATLLRHADIAMFQAKATGRDRVVPFDAEFGEAADARLALEGELRAAIDNDELVLHFQPRVAVADGRLLGVEALVRWQHPRRSLLPPARFIDIAEQSGLVVPLGAWVLRHAGRTLRRLRQAGVAGLTMSVNVCARQFSNGDLVDDVAAMIAEAGCAPRDIELELTARAVLDEQVGAAQTLGRLQALGVRLAMDNFGTGYASLATLRCFPTDVVKIDRSFVDDVASDASTAAVTRAFIAMSHSFGLHVVAVGVENSDQLEFLRRAGCDEVQGFLFAHPMPEAELFALLAKSQPPTLVAKR
jgi:diguanylate cyclase (GGDEF)-like protein